MAWEIVSFHVPSTFPYWMIPEGVLPFIEEAKGLILSEAAAKAKALGYRPLLKRMTNFTTRRGLGLWGFGLDYQGFFIPLMVMVRLPDVQKPSSQGNGA